MLVLPNGFAPKTTEPLTERELAWLIVAEDVCRKLGLTIACRKCLMAGRRADAVLKGQNDEKDSKLSVTCECRRLEFQTRATA